MADPKLSTIKRLFASSKNQCAFPRCGLPLVEGSGTVTGEVAHIKAANEKGPRYDSTQSDNERHSYDNLILLCGRHHTIVDSEHEAYPVKFLQSFKKNFEQLGAIEIAPFTAAAAQTLLQNYKNIVIQNNTGQVAVNSPGAVQAKIVNFKTNKTKITIGPPDGSVSHNFEMRSYIEYLIGRYQDYQKQNTAKDSRYKYMAIYSGIKREFDSKWQLMPEARFAELVNYLKRRIDGTKVGRIRKKRDQKRYHSFEEHCYHET